MATTDLNTERPGAAQEEPPSGPLTRLRAHMRDPLSRSGYALVLGSAITSALGMGFWVLAARLYSAADVGTASAMISAMGFLGAASTIGLKNGFVRFLPISGDAAPRFIRNAYAVCIAVAVAASVVFLIGQPYWAGELTMLRDSPLAMGFFALSTAAWTIFVLQDSVLTGLRLASWVPAENALFAVAKLGLLFVLTSIPEWGIFVAWSVPAIVLLLPVNLLIRRRVLTRPAHAEDPGGIALGDVVRFAAGDHTAALLWIGTTELLSLVVLAQAGAESAAFYFLSFQIAYSLYLLTSNVSSAFVVEAAVNPDEEGALVRKALLQVARLVVPAALICALGAPLILRILGSQYEDNAVPLLRLLVLSAIPQMFVGMAVGRARLHRHVRIVILVYLLTAISLFAGATLGLRAGGLEAVGWAWLGTQLVLAVGLVPTVLHPPIGQWVTRRLLRLGGTVRASVHQRGRALNARRVLPQALEMAGAESPRKFSLLPSHHDAIVARASIGGDPVVVRVAMTEAGAAALTANAEMLERLSGHRRLARWSAVVPAVLHHGEVDGRAFVIESFLPGQPLSKLKGAERTAALARARSALSHLHDATARQARFDDTVARRSIDEPVEVLGRLPGLADRTDDLRRLRAWLRAELVGRKVDLCWVHGDYWAGNVLVTTTDGRPRVSGIIDWENSRHDGIAAVDQAHLWLVERHEEIGAALVDALERPEEWDATATSADGTAVVGSSELPARAVLALAWLGHVAAEAGRSTDHPPSRMWTNRNVVTVLDHLDRLTLPPAPPAPPAESSTSAEPPQDAPEAAPEPAPERGRRRWRLRRSDLAAVGVLAVAVAAWVVGLWGADPRDMGPTGLISLFTPPMVAALALLTVGFVVAVRRDAPGWLLGLHVVVLIGLLHGTPAVLYDTLRYSWAWKHTGIVEYITRTGAIDTTVDVSPIYQSWPGFFTGSALLTDLVRARHSAGIATWAPVAFNLFNLFVLRALYRSITGSRRLVWLGIWFFFITNWVGQDYFSPQAMAYLLYLAIITVALRGFRRSEPVRPVLAPPMPRTHALAMMVLLVWVVSSSHQITPFLTSVALAGLALFRQIRGWYLAVLAGATMTVWAFTVGAGELEKNTRSLLDSFGRPVANAEQTFEKTAVADPALEVISQAGRLVVVVLALVAAVGVVRLWRRRTLPPALLVIAATPAALPFATEFGGEAVFRVFLFAVPALALLAAAAFEPGPLPEGRRRLLERSPVVRAHWSIPTTLAVLVLSAGMLTGYTLAYYGKEKQYAFTSEEVEAMTWIAEDARPGSLLVEGSRNYPSQFLHYEYFTYVAISREPDESWQEVLADPVDKLAHWLDNDEYTDTYLLLTRSQAIDVDQTGPMPPGSLEGIERLLRRSDRFEVVFENRDATVFQLASRAVPA